MLVQGLVEVKELLSQGIELVFQSYATRGKRIFPLCPGVHVVKGKPAEQTVLCIRDKG